MKALLDTHSFLWAITEDSRLPIAHRDIFLDPANEVYLSLASVWEILIKVGIGKLPLPLPAIEYIESQLRENRIATLAIRPEHLAELETLPLIIETHLTGC